MMIQVKNQSMQKKIIYYDAGNECTKITGGWINGKSRGSGSSAMYENSIYLYSYVTNYSIDPPVQKTRVTNSLIDLTHIKTLYMTCNKVGSNWQGATLYLAVSTNQMASYETADARKGISTKGEATISVDVSSLAGSFYIRVHGRTTSPHQNNYIKGYIYKVWGEM